MIFGFDRTFNLSFMYLTVTVLKIHFICNLKSRECSIFLGPVFLHHDGFFSTYLEFFNHLKAVLLSVREFSLKGENLTFGTDEEHALTKAISIAFPIQGPFFALNICKIL